MTRGISRFRRLLTLALLLCTASCYTLRAQGTKTPPVPNATFNPTSLIVTVGQLKFTKPTLSVIDPSTSTGKPIRGKFIERWYIKDKDGKIVTTSKVVDNRVKYTDPTTGTTVSLLYGLDAIGHKPGKFTVVDSLLPLQRYQKDYSAAAATYTVTVNPPTVTAEFYNGSTLLNGTTPKALELYTYVIKHDWGNENKSTSMPVPTAKLYYTVDNSTYDVTNDFTYKYSVTSGFSVSNNSITSSLQKESSGTLTITATPKDDNAKATYGDKPIVTTIDLKSSPRTEKIKTYITFAQHDQDVLRWRNYSNDKANNITSPDIIIKDEFGNDITSMVATKSWTLGASYTALNAFQQFSTDPNDSVKQGNEYYTLIDTHTDGISYVGVISSNNRLMVSVNDHRRPDDYLISVKVNGAMFYDNDIYENPVPSDSVTVNGQFYDDNSKNQYKIASNEYVLRVHKRVPKVVLTPDPSSVHLAQGYSMTEFNRFSVIGLFQPECGIS